MSRPQRKRIWPVLLKLFIFLFVLTALICWKNSLRKFCSEEAAARRWPHLSREARESWQIVPWIGWAVAFAQLVLEWIYKPEQIKKTIRAVAAYLAMRAGDIHAIFRVGARLVRPRMKVPKTSHYMPGQRWWEDGPFFFLFLWLIRGPPQLAHRAEEFYNWFVWVAVPSDIPFPSASLVIGIPLTVTVGVMFIQCLWWLPRVIRAAILMIVGIWKTPRAGSPYGHWLKAEFQKITESAARDFGGGWFLDQRSEEQTRPQKPTLIGWTFFALFLWLIWPALAYLFLISVLLWTSVLVLLLLSSLLSIGMQYGRIPRLAPAIAILSGLVFCWLGLS